MSARTKDLALAAALLAAAALVLLALPPAAKGGGFSVTTLDPLPATPRAGATLAVGYTVRAHGVTGKPLELGGSPGRIAATGRGLAIATQEAARAMGLPIEGARVTIQGFGNVGRHAAEALAGLGMRIVGLSDVSGALHSPAGLEVERLKDASVALGELEGVEADRITNAELLALDCEVLVPAALGAALRSDNAASVRARLVVEGANCPTTPEADAILADRGAWIVPDVIANSGGVIVSYFEWIQNPAGEGETRRG